MSYYGECVNCDIPLVPVFFTEMEYEIIAGNQYKTGRKRRAVSHLECPQCFKKEVVDDSYDGPWC